MKTVHIPIFERSRLRSEVRVQETFRINGPTQKNYFDAFCDALENGYLNQVDVSCPVCGSDEFQLIATKDRVGLDVMTVLCLDCPTMYSRKRLDEPSLELFYSEFYRGMYGGIESPTKDWFDQQSRIGQKVLEWLDEVGITKPTMDGLQVVDVGTGAGGLLHPFLKRGASVTGIDQDEKFLDFGRSMGIKMIRGGIERLREIEGADLIILKDVLEHLANQRDALKVIRSCLSPSGHCFIQVPGLQSLNALGYQNDLLRYLQIAHVVHFTEESLVYLVESAGFETVASNTHVRIVVRPSLDGRSSDLTCPTNEPARQALRHIFQTRLAFKILRFAKSLVPKSLKESIKKAIGGANLSKIKND
jgi:SAM-dependent methyltransferase